MTSKICEEYDSWETVASVTANFSTVVLLLTRIRRQSVGVSLSWGKDSRNLRQQNWQMRAVDRGCAKNVKQQARETAFDVTRSNRDRASSSMAPISMQLKDARFDIDYKRFSRNSKAAARWLSCFTNTRSNRSIRIFLRFRPLIDGSTKQRLHRRHKATKEFNRRQRPPQGEGQLDIELAVDAWSSPSTSTRSCCFPVTVIFARWLKPYSGAAFASGGIDDFEPAADDRRDELRRQARRLH